MQRCVKASRTFAACHEGQLVQRRFGVFPPSRQYGTATVQRPSRLHHEEHTARTRHLLRDMLREITYLPDSQARQWYKKYTLGRFREYGFKVWEHRHDADYEERIQSQLREARHMHNFLQRAAQGETKPLLKVLLTTYGRQGKRRHELLSALMQGGGSASSSTSISSGLTQQNGKGRDSPHASTDIPPHKTSLPGAKEVNQGAWEAYVPAFSPPLEALLKSQMANPPPHLTRPLLRSMRPRIEELNAWLRPMPKCRVKNQVKAWYADLLNRVHPPLPRSEWERLQNLATGQARESIPRRRAGCSVETVSALDMVIAYGKPSFPKLSDAHEVTPRFMRRLWAKVYEQCPVMDWDAARQQWIVIWGAQALHRLQLGENVTIILDMIKELAAFQESLDKVEATEDSLKRTLSFAPGGTQHCNTHGYAKTLILRLPREPPIEGDQPDAVAGMAMYFNNYSTWQAAPGIYLEDLFVRPQYRKRGYGKLLIRALAQEVLQIGGTRLEWSCLKSNEASLEFYERLGARQKGEWVGLRVDGEELVDLAQGKRRG
ncbi:N-acetyltransferase ats1 [Teratosphaeria destructans]|uniref:N-acetyltransferase ats1 n=1 Tax=Teratosphaeria destructans TaxID=418781 RepID=A0A9W7T012_9PEZI|nr:N-acetyltransferase ats1 [Teratosphaeria destructans]